MDLHTALLEEQSKIHANYIAGWIGDDPQRFKLLIALFLGTESRVIQRAAWVLGLVAEKYPSQILPYLSLMLERCTDKQAPVAIRRNVTRALRFISLPEELHGTAMNLCFELLADPAETVAVRCFSMDILAALSVSYPDIQPELRTIIEDVMAYGQPTPGFSSKAKKILKLLRR